MGNLHLYCEKLYFETGINNDDIPELIITAQGDESLFDKVDFLITAILLLQVPVQVNLAHS
jgi:hypothetical protein